MTWRDYLTAAESEALRNANRAETEFRSHAKALKAEQTRICDRARKRMKAHPPLAQNPAPP